MLYNRTILQVHSAGDFGDTGTRKGRHGEQRISHRLATETDGTMHIAHYHKLELHDNEHICKEAHTIHQMWITMLYRNATNFSSSDGAGTESDVIFVFSFSA